MGIGDLQCFIIGIWIIIGGPSLENFQRLWRSIPTKRHGQYQRFVGSISVTHSGPTVQTRIVCAEIFELGIDLLLTDVPDIVLVAVLAPRGNSDHSSLYVVITMAQDVPNLSVSRKYFLNIKSIEKQFMVQITIQDQPLRNIGLLTILFMF